MRPRETPRGINDIAELNIFFNTFHRLFHQLKGAVCQEMIHDSNSIGPLIHGQKSFYEGVQHFMAIFKKIKIILISSVNKTEESGSAVLLALLSQTSRSRFT